MRVLNLISSHLQKCPCSYNGHSALGLGNKMSDRLATLKTCKSDQEVCLQSALRHTMFVPC
jgi:hypothetical protein